jgi:hypothetical protein
LGRFAREMAYKDGGLSRGGGESLSSTWVAEFSGVSWIAARAAVRSGSMRSPALPAGARGVTARVEPCGTLIKIGGVSGCLCAFVERRPRRARGVARAPRPRRSEGGHRGGGVRAHRSERALEPPRGRGPVSGRGGPWWDPCGRPMSLHSLRRVRPALRRAPDRRAPEPAPTSSLPAPKRSPGIYPLPKCNKCNNVMLEGLTDVLNRNKGRSCYTSKTP